MVVVNGEPLQDQKVLGYITKRAVDHGAKLVVVSDAANAARPLGHGHAAVGEHCRATVPAVAAAQRPVVLYAAGLAAEVYDALRSAPGPDPLPAAVRRARTLPARPSRPDRAGRSRARPCTCWPATKSKAGHGVTLPEAAFTVVQAAYQTAWTDAADVVLPAQVWTEKTGHIVNIEGRELPVVPSTMAPQGVEPAEQRADQACRAHWASALN